MSDTPTQFRKIVWMGVSAVCKTTGFSTVEPQALTVLTEMLQSYLVELARYSKALAENSGRTQPIPSDVTLALIELGFDIQKIPQEIQFGSRNKIILPAPKPSGQPSASGSLKVGKSRNLPSQIPQHLPPFPDPHTYLKTHINDDTEPSYKQARLSAAATERDVEISLMNFMLKLHSDPIQLFPNESVCSVLNPDPGSQPYLSSLYPEHVQQMLGPKKTLVEEGLGESVDNPFLRPPSLPRGNSHSLPPQT